MAQEPAPPSGQPFESVYVIISPAKTMAYLPSQLVDSIQLVVSNKAAVDP